MVIQKSTSLSYSSIIHLLISTSLPSTKREITPEPIVQLINTCLALSVKLILSVIELILLIVVLLTAELYIEFTDAQLLEILIRSSAHSFPNSSLLECWLSSTKCSIISPISS